MPRSCWPGSCEEQLKSHTVHTGAAVPKRVVLVWEIHLSKGFVPVTLPPYKFIQVHVREAEARS